MNAIGRFSIVLAVGIGCLPAAARAQGDAPTPGSAARAKDRATPNGLAPRRTGRVPAQAVRRDRAATPAVVIPAAHPELSVTAAVAATVDPEPVGRMNARLLDRDTTEKFASLHHCRNDLGWRKRASPALITADTLRLRSPIAARARSPRWTSSAARPFIPVSSTASRGTRTAGCSRPPPGATRGSIARWFFGACPRRRLVPDGARAAADPLLTRRTGRGEDVLPRGLADRDHRRVLDLALDRDGVELLADRRPTGRRRAPVAGGGPRLRSPWAPRRRPGRLRRTPSPARCRRTRRRSAAGCPGRRTTARARAEPSRARPGSRNGAPSSERGKLAAERGGELRGGEERRAALAERMVEGAHRDARRRRGRRRSRRRRCAAPARR